MGRVAEESREESLDRFLYFFIMFNIMDFLEQQED